MKLKLYQLIIIGFVTLLTMLVASGFYSIYLMRAFAERFDKSAIASLELGATSEMASNYSTLQSKIAEYFVFPNEENRDLVYEQFGYLVYLQNQIDATSDEVVERLLKQLREQSIKVQFVFDEIAQLSQQRTEIMQGDMARAEDMLSKELDDLVISAFEESNTAVVYYASRALENYKQAKLDLQMLLRDFSPIQHDLVITELTNLNTALQILDNETNGTAFRTDIRKINTAFETFNRDVRQVLELETAVNQLAENDLPQAADNVVEIASGLTEHFAEERDEVAAELAAAIARDRTIFISVLIIAILISIGLAILNTWQLRARIGRISNQLENGMNAIVQGVATSGDKVANEVSTVSANAEQSSAQSIQVKGRAHQLDTSLQDVSAAAAEMSSSLGELAGNIREVAESVEVLSTQADETNNLVGSLGEAVLQIDEVLVLINTLAEKTNLLALNAAIEAARAGEAGAGFAVVAEEVKHLADQTSEAIDQVNGHVSQIKATSGQAIDAIYAITSGVQNVGQRAQDMSAAVSQQNSSTEIISANINSAATATADVASSIEELSTSANTTGQSANNLLAVTSDLEAQSDKLSQQSTELITALRRL